MKQNGRVNALLVELLIVVLFFMLASTTLMEIFGAAKQSSTRAGACSTAMLQAQNMAEVLYAAPSVPDKLTELGFVQTENGWQLDCGNYLLTADYNEEPTTVGFIKKTVLKAEHSGETLFSLPVDRYMPGEVQP